MTQRGGSRPECWCGSGDTRPFHGPYRRCQACGTLLVAGPAAREGRVEDDHRDFYGHDYYRKHLVEDYGFPPIEERARRDLSERCLHWLRTLLRYKLPPGRTLELGAAHGAFVALLGSAGFTATGLELSPSVVEFARRTFGVTMLYGPIEDHPLEPASFDVIILMDVLEHLPDPVGTLGRCLSLLRPDGIVLVQTPCYPEGASYAELEKRGSDFLQQLKPQEHLFLFTERSVTQLLERLGLAHVRFEPAIFAQYDMFLAASRAELTPVPQDAADSALLGSTPARLVLALRDVDEMRRDLDRKREELEADRRQRLSAIEDLGSRLGTADGQAKRLASLLGHKQESLAVAEKDRSERQGVIEDLGRRLGVAEGEAGRLQALLEQKAESLAATEKDRSERQAVIEDLGRRLGVVEGEAGRLRALLAQQEEALAATEKDRSERQDVIEDLGRRLGVAEGETRRLEALLGQKEQALAVAERDREERLKVIEDQGRRSGELEARIHDQQRRLVLVEEERSAAEAERSAAERARVAGEQALDEQHRLAVALREQLQAAEGRLSVLMANPLFRILIRLGLLPRERSDGADAGGRREPRG